MIKREDISKRILNYLQRNPEAGDTLEGIVNWWLEMEGIEVSVAEVKRGLESLIREGLIREIKTKSSIILYKIKQNDCGEWKSETLKPWLSNHLNEF